MTEQKMVKVPQEHLDKVEEARLALYAWFEESFGNDPELHQVIRMTNITSALWRIANTKYEEVK